jgi:hypothetical protein
VLAPNSHGHPGNVYSARPLGRSLHYASYPFPISLLLAISISPSTLGIFQTLSKKPLFYSEIMSIISTVAALPDVRYRQRVQKRLTRLRKRLLAFVIKANPECFDHGGRLAHGCLPARVPPEAANLHGLMRRAECKLAMIRCHAECPIGKS